MKPVSAVRHYADLYVRDRAIHAILPWLTMIEPGMVNVKPRYL
jgi:hypothetical protein